MLAAPDIITSRQNPKIKNIVQLQKHANRLKQNLFIIEGLKEIEKANIAGYKFNSVFYQPDIINTGQVIKLTGNVDKKNIFAVNHDVYSKIAYREDSGGIIALATPGNHSFENLQTNKNPLILVIDGVEKPGNLGAIFRTADAAGIDLIIITAPATDLYNPNSIRASLGCVFTVKSIICEPTQAINWLRNNNIAIYCSYLQAAIPYHNIDYTKPSAIVMGTEATGLTNNWLNYSDSNIIIPMQGAADSMNVSVAAAVLVFEARRQRGFV